MIEVDILIYEKFVIYLKTDKFDIDVVLLLKGIFLRFGKLTKLKKVLSDSHIFFLVMIFVRKQ